MVNEQQQIENHLNKHNGGWYNILCHFVEKNPERHYVKFEWGRYERVWTKTLKLKQLLDIN